MVAETKRVVQGAAAAIKRSNSQQAKPGERALKRVWNHLPLSCGSIFTAVFDFVQACEAPHADDGTNNAFSWQTRLGIGDEAETAAFVRHQSAIPLFSTAGFVETTPRTLEAGCFCC